MIKFNQINPHAPIAHKSADELVFRHFKGEVRLILGATKKICRFILETKNCAKSYFRNCPNYPNCLNPEIIGGHYFKETHKNKYIKISRNFV